MKCRYCRKEVTEVISKRPIVCKDAECIEKYFDEYQETILRRAEKRRRSEQAKIDRELKEKMKTHSQWLKDLQRVFNKYIRERDKYRPCISCGEPLRGKFDAGHLFSVGAHPELRFDEDNVHGQCVRCNQHLHGNSAYYKMNISYRIGEKRFQELLDRRGQIGKLSIPEIKEKIKYYKEKIKGL